MTDSFNLCFKMNLLIQKQKLSYTENESITLMYLFKKYLAFQFLRWEPQNKNKHINS